MAENKVHNETLIPWALDDLMGERFGKYAKYIIQERALPDARDGLKPVQRRILYAMYEEGNTFEKPTRKSAKTVGNVMGTYHPHGDSSIYDAMVRMSQDWKMGEVLIDMQGNNGSMDDDPAAAMRYTEARLAKIASELLKDIEKDTVLLALNFDDTLMEPTVLPARFPNILINGVNGIAAGYATHIPPHNLSEIIDATIFRIYNPYCTLEDIMELVKGPDFPTGGIVQGIDGIKQAFKSGKGRVLVKSKCTFEEGKNINQIIISEIPYEVIKSVLVRKMDEIRLNKDIDGVLAVRDESGRDGLRIVVDVKKEANMQLVLNYFYKNTDLQIYYNYNVVAIVNKTPQQMGIIALLDAYIEHRCEVVLRRTKFDYEKCEKRCHVLEGLIKALGVLDEVIEIIRSSKDKSDSKKNLIARFAFSEEQVEAIVTLQLYRLSSTDVKDLRNEFAKLVNLMEELQLILSDRKVLHNTIVKELKEIMAEYPRARRSVIEDLIEEITIDKHEMVTSEKVMVAISKDGYVKKISLRSYNTNSDTVCGLKDGDRLVAYKELDTLDKLLIFTNKGRYAYVPVFELKEAKWKEIGEHLSSVVKISGDEKIVSAIVCDDFDTACYIVCLTRNGLIKRTTISEFVLARYSKPAIAISLKGSDELISAKLAYDLDEVLVLSVGGYLVRYRLNQIPCTAPKSSGVKAMNLTSDKAGAMSIHHGFKSMLCLISNKNTMKRIRLDEIEYNNRPVKGELIAKKVKSNPIEFNNMAIIDVSDSFDYVDDKSFLKLDLKDVPIMEKSATVSSCLKEYQYLLSDIERAEKKEAIISEESGGEIQLSFDLDDLLNNDDSEFN